MPFHLCRVDVSNYFPSKHVRRPQQIPYRALAASTLSIAACISPAIAQEISSETNIAVRTSTAANGSAADVEITEDGSIEVAETGGFVAVSVDSDNSVQNDGLIDIEDSDNAIGILLLPGFSGDVRVSGEINVHETYEREDEDDDDDLDGAYAIGENRAGIMLQSGGAFTGSVTTESTSSIIVEGNDSSGISLLSALDGSVILDGSISVIGDNAAGFVAADEVSGGVLFSGAVTAQGENATAIELQDDIGGGVTIESAVTSYGFGSLVSSNYISPSSQDEDTEPVEDRLDAEVLLDNRAAMIVNGSAANGILINGIIDDFVSDEEADDETKDTIEDFDENRSAGGLYSYGSGEALLISSDGRASDLVVGSVHETVRDTLDDDDDDDVTETLAEFDYSQGLINRGTIRSNGLNVGFDATGLRIEGADDGSSRSIIEGGIFSSGTIEAKAFEADAVAASIGANTEIGLFENDGAVTATTYTNTDDHSATALSLDAGADIHTLVNSGSVIATSIGQKGDALAIVDASGALSVIENTGTILVSLTSDGQTVDEADYGATIALDLSQNTSGVSYSQFFATPDDDTDEDGDLDSDDVATPYITGDIYFGSGDDSFLIQAGSVTGDIDFMSGDETFLLSDAVMSGDLNFGSGAHDLTISGDATYTGSLNFAGSAATVSIIDSTFGGTIHSDTQAIDLYIDASDASFSLGSEIALSSLNVLNDSRLTFHIDPYDPSSAIMTVAGAAVIGSDTQIAPVLSSLSATSFTQVLIDAGSLSFDGGLSQTALDNIPYIYDVSLLEADDTLSLVFDIKSAEDLGLDTNQAAAFSSLIGVLASDDELGATVTEITTQQEFEQTYNLLLPQRTNASTQYLVAQSAATYGALTDRLDVASLGGDTKPGIWFQENFTYLNENASDDSPGYNGDGLSFSMGADAPFMFLDRVGALLNYSWGSFEEKTGGTNPVDTTSFGVGLYAQEKVGIFDLRAAGQISTLDFSSTREVELGFIPYATNSPYEISGEWEGQSRSIMTSASTTFELGSYYLKPKASYDWFSVDQDGYTETGGDDLIDASVSEVSTDQSSVTGVLSLGKTFTTDNAVLKTEVSGGYRSIISATPYQAEVSYLGSDESFMLVAQEEVEDAALFGASLMAEGGAVSGHIGYDFEKRDNGDAHYFGASIKLKF